jgi:chromosome partitioning protein
MKVIAIANNKGGVAKTTSVQNIAVEMVNRGNRVLVVDLDAQGSLSRCFGVDVDTMADNVGSLLLGRADLEDVALTNGQLTILPANKKLNEIESALRSSPKYPQNLKLILKPYQDDFDFVLLDCPPALSVFTHLALVACDFYFVPLQVEFLSYEGLREFLSYAGELEELYSCQLGGVFATRFNPNYRDSHGRSVVKNTSMQLGDDFMQSYIRNNNAISKAQLKRQSVIQFDPESNGAKDYKSLTTEIINRVQ